MSRNTEQLRKKKFNSKTDYGVVKIFILKLVTNKMLPFCFKNIPPPPDHHLFRPFATGPVQLSSGGGRSLNTRPVLLFAFMSDMLVGSRGRAGHASQQRNYINITHGH